MTDLARDKAMTVEWLDGSPAASVGDRYGVSKATVHRAVARVMKAAGVEKSLDLSVIRCAIAGLGATVSPDTPQAMYEEITRERGCGC